MGQMPVQAATYIGFLVDFLRREFYLPERKIMKRMGKIMEFRCPTSVSLHQDTVLGWVKNFYVGLEVLYFSCPAAVYVREEYEKYFCAVFLHDT